MLIYQCKKCGFVSKNESIFRKHMESRHYQSESSAFQHNSDDSNDFSFSSSFDTDSGSSGGGGSDSDIGGGGGDFGGGGSSGSWEDED